MSQYLNVAQRRVYGEDYWVCESCGDTHEEGLVMWATGRSTRSDPHGTRVICLCHYCEERIPHGKFVDQ
jgi:hypothetical protein